MRWKKSIIGASTFTSIKSFSPCFENWPLNERHRFISPATVASVPSTSTPEEVWWWLSHVLPCSRFHNACFHDMGWMCCALTLSVEMTVRMGCAANSPICNLLVEEILILAKAGSSILWKRALCHMGSAWGGHGGMILTSRKRGVVERNEKRESTDKIPLGRSKRVGGKRHQQRRAGTKSGYLTPTATTGAN